MRQVRLSTLIDTMPRVFAKENPGDWTGNVKYIPRTQYRVMVDGNRVDYIEKRIPDEDEIAEGRAVEYNVEFVDNDFTEYTDDVTVAAEVYEITETEVL